MSSIDIRRGILETLYKSYVEDPDAYVSHSELQKRIGCSSSELRSNTKYLEGRNFLKVDWSTTDKFAAQIQPAGIDLLEDESEFNRKFPLNVTIMKHYGKGAQVHVGSRSNVTVIEDSFVENSFNRIYGELRKREPNAQARRNVATKIRELQEEMKSDNPSSHRIRGIVEFLKTNAAWIVPMVKDTIEKILSAKYAP